MFSHGPMAGAREAKGLVWCIFLYAKGEKLGPWGTMDPVDPLDLLLIMLLILQKINNIGIYKLVS